MRSGLDKARIVIDPGLGFGKRKEENTEILARLSLLQKLDIPVLVGPSRKSFLKQSTDSRPPLPPPPPSPRPSSAGLMSSASTTSARMCAVIRVADAVLRGMQT